LLCSATHLAAAAVTRPQKFVGAASLQDASWLGCLQIYTVHSLNYLFSLWLLPSNTWRLVCRIIYNLSNNTAECTCGANFVYNLFKKGILNICWLTYTGVTVPGIDVLVPHVLRFPGYLETFFKICKLYHLNTLKLCETYHIMYIIVFGSEMFIPEPGS
jgi:hypothetical protein